MCNKAKEDLHSYQQEYWGRDQHDDDSRPYKKSYIGIKYEMENFSKYGVIYTSENKIDNMWGLDTEYLYLIDLDEKKFIVKTWDNIYEYDLYSIHKNWTKQIDYDYSENESDELVGKIASLNCDRQWVIVETYYKHAEYTLNIIKSDDKLREYLEGKLEEYNEEYEIEQSASENLESLIEMVEDMGNRMVESERGWGVREIREIM